MNPASNKRRVSAQFSPAVLGKKAQNSQILKQEAGAASIHFCDGWWSLPNSTDVHKRSNSCKRSKFCEFWVLLLQERDSSRMPPPTYSSLEPNKVKKEDKLRSCRLLVLVLLIRGPASKLSIGFSLCQLKKDLTVL